MGAIMSFNIPFQVAQGIGTNIAEGMQRGQERNTIEDILSQASQTDDPAVLQQSIGKILSSVRPENQAPAMQYIQNTMKNLEKRKQDQQLQQQGINPNNPEWLQKEEFKNKAKQERLSQYGLTPDSTSRENQNYGSQQQPKLQSSIFRKLSDDQLVVSTGAEDREVSEPAKAELKRREEEAKINRSRESDVFKSDLARSSKLLEEADQISMVIPQKRSSLQTMRDAVVTKDLSFFTPDNMAEMTGIEGLRSPEGALFKTAGKEYFLGNIQRAGARPNQWIEQQISDMLPKMGRSVEANLSVMRALENELALDQARVDFTNSISDKLRSEGDYSQGKLGRLLNQQMSEFAMKKQDILFNDLRAIKSISENKPQTFKKVESGTKISDYMVQSLLKQFNNDPKKAAQEAKKLGYDFD